MEICEDKAGQRVAGNEAEAVAMIDMVETVGDTEFCFLS